MTKTTKKAFDLDEILSSPLVLWIIAVTSAVLMWVYVTGMDESAYINRKFSAPIEYRYLDPQAILRGRLSEVDIEVRGPEEEIMRLDYNSIIAYVNARNLVPGKRYTVNIDVDLPAGNVTLISCFPSQAVLDLVRQVTRLMNVETVLPQNIPEGQYIEGVEIIPKEVGIKGAEDDVAKVGSVRVTPTIEELQAGRDLLMPVKFSQSEPFEGTVTIEPAQVRFRGVLARGLPKKRVPVNVRLSGKLDSDYEIRAVITDPSEVQIEGDADDLAKVEAIDTEVIDISLLASNQVIVAPLRQPEVKGISLANANSVKVSLQLGEVHAEKKLNAVPVELRGVPENSGHLICNPSSVAVTIEGRPSLIEQLEADDLNLKAFVDMSNIFMTPVTLPVRAEILSGDQKFRVTRIDPQNAVINVFEAE
ncbi:MAG: hypothetical protein II917_10190 [Synergistaceae bacterium]|nr:hypothetical protein [Synergistaceae bacterium]